MKTANDMCDFLPQDVDLRDQLLGIVDTGNEDLILDGFGLSLCVAGEGFEAINDVITVKVSNIQKRGLVYTYIIA